MKHTHHYFTKSPKTKNIQFTVTVNSKVRIVVVIFGFFFSVDELICQLVISGLRFRNKPKLPNVKSTKNTVHVVYYIAIGKYMYLLISISVKYA